MLIRGNLYKYQMARSGQKQMLKMKSGYARILAKKRYSKAARHWRRRQNFFLGRVNKYGRGGSF